MRNASSIAHLNRYQRLGDDSSLLWLEKAPSGKVTLDDIQEALGEFTNLFKAGLASKAEILTLARAFPDSLEYTQAAGKHIDSDPMVIGGPASVELVDREGHLITTQALSKAFKKFMDNSRTRNVMVLHSDVQVGWALPAYISQGGQIFKSGVDDKGLFFICELRDDTAISKKVAEQIQQGQLKSYSIAGSATKTQNMTKGLTPYLQVDDMELAEVTVCEKGVNQGASFELLKAEVPQTGKVDKDQCGYRDATPPETALGINCGHCKYFNSEDKTCDVVVGDILPGDYCKLFEPCEEAQSHTQKVVIMHSENTGKVSWNNTFKSWISKDEDPLKSGKSFTTLHNEEGRQEEHKQLLREYGFPLEMDAEEGRYIPVVEVETDEDGVPIHNLPPWVVNEAGEALGNRGDFTEAKAKASNKIQPSGEKAKKTTQKMFLATLSKAFDVDKAKPRDEVTGKRIQRKPSGKKGATNLAREAVRRATPIGDPTKIQQTPDIDSDDVEKREIGGKGWRGSPTPHERGTPLSEMIRNKEQHDATDAVQDQESSALDDAIQRLGGMSGKPITSIRNKPKEVEESVEKAPLSRYPRGRNPQQSLTHSEERRQRRERRQQAMDGANMKTTNNSPEPIADFTPASTSPAPAPQPSRSRSTQGRLARMFGSAKRGAKNIGSAVERHGMQSQPMRLNIENADKITTDRPYTPPKPKVDDPSNVVDHHGRPQPDVTQVPSSRDTSTNWRFGNRTPDDWHKGGPDADLYSYDDMKSTVLGENKHGKLTYGRTAETDAAQSDARRRDFAADFRDRDTARLRRTSQKRRLDREAQEHHDRLQGEGQFTNPQSEWTPPNKWERLKRTKGARALNRDLVDSPRDVSMSVTKSFLKYMEKS